jgi:uncharacterized membrane protein YvbJ
MLRLGDRRSIKDGKACGNEMMKTRYFCESCGREVSAKAATCPSCGKAFTAVRCPHCGFEGKASAFTAGCPVCGFLQKPDQTPSDAAPVASPTAARGRRPLPARFYTVLAVVLLAFLAVLVVLLFKT